VSEYWTFETGQVRAHPELASIAILDVALQEATKALVVANPDVKHFARHLAKRLPIPWGNHQLWALLRTIASLRESIAGYERRVTHKELYDEIPF
jgi:hypothetical protein